MTRSKAMLNGREVEVWCPTERDIEGLQVGSVAPNCFGKLARVVSIFAKGTDINGRPYACVYLAFGNYGDDGSTISESYKADEVHRHVNIGFSSAEVDRIESEIRWRRAARKAEWAK